MCADRGSFAGWRGSVTDPSCVEREEPRGCWGSRPRCHHQPFPVHVHILSLKPREATPAAQGQRDRQSSSILLFPISINYYLMLPWRIQTLFKAWFENLPPWALQDPSSPHPESSTPRAEILLSPEQIVRQGQKNHSLFCELLSLVLERPS